MRLRFSNSKFKIDTNGTFERVIETRDSIYYKNFSLTKSKSIKRYDRKMIFISDGMKAYNDMKKEMGDASWISEKMKKHLELNK